MRMLQTSRQRLFFSGTNQFVNRVMQDTSFWTTINTDKYNGSFVCTYNFGQKLYVYIRYTYSGTLINVPLEMLNVHLRKIYKFIGSSGFF